MVLVLLTASVKTVGVFCMRDFSVLLPFPHLSCYLCPCLETFCLVFLYLYSVLDLSFRLLMLSPQRSVSCPPGSPGLPAAAPVGVAAGAGLEDTLKGRRAGVLIWRRRRIARIPPVQVISLIKFGLDWNKNNRTGNKSCDIWPICKHCCFKQAQPKMWHSPKVDDGVDIFFKLSWKRSFGQFFLKNFKLTSNLNR